MLLTITTTHAPATDLGYLLHKNPARAQSFDLSFGRSAWCATVAGQLARDSCWSNTSTTALTSPRRS